jgi:hypothetical protein
MAGRRRKAFWVVGILGVAVAATTLAVAFRSSIVRPARAPVVFNENTPTSVLVQGLRDSDGRALDVLFKQLTAHGDTKPAALSDAEAEVRLEALVALRHGFSGFGSQGRVTALIAGMAILDRFAIEPAPQNWTEALFPLRELLLSGVADSDLEVRVRALGELGRIWSWVPGRTLARTQEMTLAEFKDAFYPTAKLRLGDAEPAARAAAVACFGLLPIDQAAEPALAYLEDPNGTVRKQVLISFAARQTLLSEDAIARHFYDTEPGMPELVEIVLKTRGLSTGQIGLARLINHPKPGMRVSVIPLLDDRTDVDPIVWLIQLSQDVDESVRMSAVEALAVKDAPEAKSRLAEMARSDRSAAVRQAAGRHTTTASLPPLPGSPSLNPKAN